MTESVPDPVPVPGALLTDRQVVAVTSTTMSRAVESFTQFTHCGVQYLLINEPLILIDISILFHTPSPNSPARV